MKFKWFGIFNGPLSFLLEWSYWKRFLVFKQMLDNWYLCNSKNEWLKLSLFYFARRYVWIYQIKHFEQHYFAAFSNHFLGEKKIVCLFYAFLVVCVYLFWPAILVQSLKLYVNIFIGSISKIEMLLFKFIWIWIVLINTNETCECWAHKCNNWIYK